MEKTSKQLNIRLPRGKIRTGSERIVMKQFQTAYTGGKQFRAAVTEWKKHQESGAALIHLFSDGAKKEEITDACSAIDEIMPDAAYLGSSASGCICGGRVSAEKLVVSCTLFEKPDSFARPVFFPVDDDVSSFREQLRGQAALLSGVKAVEMITTIDTVPIRDVCKVVQQELPEEIPVWGGGAFGDNTKPTISLRISPVTLQKAKQYGKGYTGLLSRLLDVAINDEELVRKCI